MTKESDAIADSMIGSEPFMWLMVGANHPEAHLETLRKAYAAWLEAGGVKFRDRI